MVLTGCSSDKDNKPKTKPSASPTESTSPAPNPSSEAEQAVLNAYDAYWEAQKKVYKTGSLKGVDLQPSIADKALAKVRVTTVYYEDRGLAMEGEPKLDPKVTALSLKQDPHTATITDCVDNSDYFTVYKKTGKRVKTTDTVRRHPQTTKVQMIGKKWIVVDATIARDRTC